MKTRWVALMTVALGIPPLASGQIEVGCRLVANRVLLFEPIRATVRIANNTGHRLVFSGSRPNARLGFQIEQTPGLSVMPTSQPLLEGPLMLEPGEIRELEFNLLPKYLVRATGPYTIQARLEWNETAFLSPKVFLDVLPGFEVARFSAGLAGSAGGIRVFSLKTLTRDRMELLFLRVDDQATGQCLGVFNLGRIVRQFNPQIKADGLGHVHVLHQSSPWKFTHTEVTMDGIPVVARDFAAYDSEVHLERTPGGEVVVRGIRPPADSSLFEPPPSRMPVPAGVSQE